MLDKINSELSGSIATRLAWFLNEILKADKEAVDRIFDTRVPCNSELAEHPTVQVGIGGDGNAEVGILGILNGFTEIVEAWRVVAEIDTSAKQNHPSINRFFPIAAESYPKER